MDVTKLLSGFASEVLKAIIKHEDLSVWTDNAKKGDLVSALESYSNHIGFVIFTESLTRDELFDACTHLKIDLSSAGSRPNKAVLKKRLQEKLEELGPQKFCDKFGDNSALVSAFAEALDLDDPKDSKKASKEIGKRLTQLGVESLLNRLDLQFLKNMAASIGINAGSLDKPRVVESIIAGKVVKRPENTDSKKRIEKERKEAEKAANKDKRADIKKGVSYQDLYQGYNADELVEFCRKNSLKVTGKKPDVIKRILAWLNGDTETTMSTKKEKKRKSESPSKSKSPKKVKTTDKKE